MKSLLLTGMSFMLTTFVVGNAYYQKQQFYPSVVYITKSNPSMAVMYIQALVFVILTAKLLRKLFFGQLRAAEMEHLIERSWYAVTETCLAFTVFRDDFSPRFVALFTLLLFLKCFHWLAEDRIDFMERSPAISWLFHMRALSLNDLPVSMCFLINQPRHLLKEALIFVLAILDILFVRHAFYSTILKGPSVQLVFGFEYEILLTVVLMTFIKYLLHTIDLQNENPWDNKAMYLLYSELIIGFIRVVLYILFFAVMIKVHTFPLFAIRPMYLTLRAFQKAAQDVILSRRAIRNMNTLYPDATPEELSSGDNVCIICREEMTTGCKKLPCNHILHTNCLRSWFQRQQTCPTCRLEVLRMPQGNGQQRPQQNQQQQQAQQAQPAAQQQQPQQPQPPQNPFNNMQGMFGGMPFQWPPNMAGQAMPPPFGWPPQQQQQPQPPTTSTTSPATSSQAASGSTAPSVSTTSAAAPTTTATSSAPSAATSAFPGTSSQAPLPPFSGMPFMSPPMMPSMMNPMGFPTPPRPMEGLSEQELRIMEGIERTNVEARVHWLRDIQTLLDGAMVLIGQYNTVASHLGSPGVQLTQPSTSFNPSAPAMSSNSNSNSSCSQSITTSPSSQSSSSLQQQPTWWPAGQGARPKYTSPPSNVHSHNSSKAMRVSSQPDSEHHQVIEGATAMRDTDSISPPTESFIPKWDGPENGEQEDESMHEIRKRRLQRFEQSNDVNSSPKSNDVSESS